MASFHLLITRPWFDKLEDIERTPINAGWLTVLADPSTYRRGPLVVQARDFLRENEVPHTIEISRAIGGKVSEPDTYIYHDFVRVRIDDPADAAVFRMHFPELSVA